MLAAAVVAVAAWRRLDVGAVAAVVTATVIVRRGAFALGLAVLVAVAVVRSDHALEGLAPDVLGPYSGWATVAADPAPVRGATRVILQIDGERYECWVRGSAGQQRVSRWHQGDVAWVAGRRRPLTPERADRVAWQHVVGEFERDWFGDVRDGRPLAVAANRVRGLVARGTAVLPDPRAALARGLIIGDDRDQPPAVTERFRASGLSHLTAVSGQNVGYVLAAAGPLLRRTATAGRLVATVALIAWFVVLTRAEPSILRAGLMAALAAVAFAVGREREPPRLLALAVIGLLLVDPLLVRSVGFWLSVGATAGVTIVAPPLARSLRRLGPAALPVAVTLGAQVGVALPSLLVFGRLSFVSTFANLLAVPVAGLVMLVGLPAALIAGALPPLAGVVMFPVDIGVRWVDGVACVGERLQPPVAVNAVGWTLITLAVLVLTRGGRIRSAAVPRSDSVGGSGGR
jgi:competence protein ComEC